MNTAYPTLADIQHQYVVERSARYFDSYGRSPRDTDAIIQERDGYTMRTIATFGELKANERPELAHFFTDYLGLCDTCYAELPDEGDCTYCAQQSELPALDTTADYMAYHAGFAAGQKEYRELPESSIRAMHAAMRQSLALPASYPAGITGTDRAHLEGRCDAYGYYLNNRPEPTYAIRSRRTGIWLRQGAIGFTDQMAAIKWAKDYANDYQVIVTIHHGTDGPVCVTVIPD